LTDCFNIRSRQDSRSAALGDVQRALNIISREVASAGYGLDAETTNGVVGCDSGGANCDSDDEAIRVRSNLNRFESTPPDADTDDTDEDVMFFVGESDNTSYLARYDANEAASTVLANRIDKLQFHYFDKRVTYATVEYDPDDEEASLLTGVKNSSGAAQAEVSPDKAKYVVVVVVVRLPAVGTQGAEGYQPETQEVLVSDVALRNSDLANY
jgi:hypothetical protein